MSFNKSSMSPDCMDVSPVLSTAEFASDSGTDSSSASSISLLLSPFSGSSTFVPSLLRFVRGGSAPSPVEVPV